MALNSNDLLNLQLQIVDVLSLGLPVVFNRSISSLLYAAASNLIQENLVIATGSQTIALPANSLYGIVYVRFLPTNGGFLTLTLANGGNLIAITLNPGGVFLVFSPGASPATGWSSGAITSINMTPSAPPATIEYLVAT